MPSTIRGGDNFDSGQKLTPMAAQNSTSGTAIDFTGIPSWAKRVTVMLSGVSTNSTSNLVIQLGTSGGFETSGYLGTVIIGSGGTAANYSSGFQLTVTEASADVHHGAAVIDLLGSNTWVERHALGQSNGATVRHGAGSKALGGVLDRIRVTTAGGTATFDAGVINVMYE